LKKVLTYEDPETMSHN